MSVFNASAIACTHMVGGAGRRGERKGRERERDGETEIERTLDKIRKIGGGAVVMLGMVVHAYNPNYAAGWVLQI